MRFQGSVTFDAHGGMLKSTLTELGLEVGEEGLVITCLEAPMNQGRCAIAKLGPVEAGEGRHFDPPVRDHHGWHVSDR